MDELHQQIYVKSVKGTVMVFKRHGSVRKSGKAKVCMLMDAYYLWQGRAIISRRPEYSGVKLLIPECSGVRSEELSTPENNISIQEHEILHKMWYCPSNILIVGQKNDHEISEISKAYVGELVSAFRTTHEKTTYTIFQA